MTQVSMKDLLKPKNFDQKDKEEGEEESSSCGLTSEQNDDLDVDTPISTIKSPKHNKSPSNRLMGVR